MVRMAQRELPDDLAKHQVALRSYLDDWCAQQERLLHDALLQRDEDCLGGRQAKSNGATAQEPLALGGLQVVEVQTEPCTPRLPEAEGSQTETSAKADLGEDEKSSNGSFERAKQALEFNSDSFKKHEGKLEHMVSRVDDVGEKNTILYMLGRFERSIAFETVCQLVIVANTVTLAGSTEYFVHHPYADGHSVYDGFEEAFCYFYTLEIVLRMVVQRLAFWVGPEMTWNLFELFLVITSLQELFGSGLNLSYTRTIRVAKVLKVLKVVRIVRVFKELRLILDSLMGSMTSLFWSFVLVAAIDLMFGMCFVQAVTDAFSNPDISDAAKEDMHTYWGSLSVAVLSLFQASTGGADWGDIAAPLLVAGPQYYVIFVFYIGLFLFVVMNSLTSLFVDSVMQYAENNQEDILRDRAARKHEYVAKLVGLFNEMAKDEADGQVTLEDFRKHMGDPRMQAFSASMDLEVCDLERLFDALTHGGHRALDLDSFVVGCLRLRGGAKNIDIQGLIATQKHLAIEQHNIETLCVKHEKQLTRITRRQNSAAQSRVVRPIVEAKALPPQPDLVGFFDLDTSNRYSDDATSAADIAVVVPGSPRSSTNI